MPPRGNDRVEDAAIDAVIFVEAIKDVCWVLSVAFSVTLICWLLRSLFKCRLVVRF